MVKDNSLISVIIPVFNVKRFLNKCVESLLRQPYKNIEVILVDDGSSDGSSEICNEWSVKDSRVIVVHKQNGGVCSARNEGIKKAKGTFITFVDSDDYVDDNFIKAINIVLKNKKIDIASFGYEKNGKCHSCYNNIVLRPNIKKDLEKYLLLNVYISSCIKFINRDFLIKENLFFGTGRRSEDFEWSFRTVLKSKMVLLSNIVYYHYFTNTDSETHKVSIEAIFDHYKNTKKVLNALNRKKINNRQKCYSKIFETNIYYLKMASKLNEDDKKAFIEFYKKNRQLFIRPKNIKLRLTYYFLKIFGIKSTLSILKKI